MHSKKLILELLPKAQGHAFSSFAVYVPTSAMGGAHFVRYNFAFKHSDVRDAYTPNSGTNVSLYRIREAHLVCVTDVGEAGVVQEVLCEVLQKGELSLAMREDLPDVAHLAPTAKAIERGDERYSADFIGGIHGDERLTDVALTVDGHAIDLTANNPHALYCAAVQFCQASTLYRWGTSHDGYDGDPVAAHTQRITVNADGLQNRQSVHWLCNDFHTRKNATFLQMFTMKREWQGKPVCERFEAFDGDGRSLGSVSLSLPVSEECHQCLPSPATRTVRYSSATSGISAEVGFTLLGDSLRTDKTWIHVRVPQADNKFYASFSSAKNGRVPQYGELWELALHAHIDYTLP